MKKGTSFACPLRRGFTLLELMIVIGIAALLMTTAVPFIGGLMNERPLVQTTNDVLDVLSQARAQAILQGKISVLEIHPLEGTFKVLAAGAKVNASEQESMQFIENASNEGSAEGLGNSTAKIHEDVFVEMLEVNFMNVKAEPVAEVHFYPNGTCDMFAILLQKEDQYRMIKLDMITGLARFETDPEKFEKM